MVDKIGLDKPKVNESTVDKIAVDEPGPHLLLYIMTGKCDEQQLWSHGCELEWA